MLHLIDDGFDQPYIAVPVYSVVFLIIVVEKNGFEIFFRSCPPSRTVFRNYT